MMDLKLYIISSFFFFSIGKYSQVFILFVLMEVEYFVHGLYFHSSILGSLDLKTSRLAIILLFVALLTKYHLFEKSFKRLSNRRHPLKLLSPISMWKRRQKHKMYSWHKRTMNNLLQIKFNF